MAKEERFGFWREETKYCNTTILGGHVGGRSPKGWIYVAAITDDQVMHFLDSLSTSPEFQQVLQEVQECKCELSRWLPPVKRHVLEELTDAYDHYLDWHMAKVAEWASRK